MALRTNAILVATVLQCSQDDCLAAASWLRWAEVERTFTKEGGCGNWLPSQSALWQPQYTDH